MHTLVAGGSVPRAGAAPIFEAVVAAPLATGNRRGVKGVCKSLFGTLCDTYLKNTIFEDQYVCFICQRCMHVRHIAAAANPAQPALGR